MASLCNVYLGSEWRWMEDDYEREERAKTSFKGEEGTVIGVRTGWEEWEGRVTLLGYRVEKNGRVWQMVWEQGRVEWGSRGIVWGQGARGKGWVIMWGKGWEEWKGGYVRTDGNGAKGKGDKVIKGKWRMGEVWLCYNKGEKNERV